MTPPSTLENCPPEIRANPLPGDECTPPDPPPFVLPEHRFRYFSVSHEFTVPLVSNADYSTRVGVMALFRPMSRLGIGAMLDSDFGEQLTFHGRLQGSFWLDRYGMWRLNTAALAGFRHVFEQPRITESGAEAKVAGTNFSMGLELALDIQLLRIFSVTPFTRFLSTPATQMGLVDDPATKVDLPNQYEFSTGLRVNFDFFPNH